MGENQVRIFDLLHVLGWDDDFAIEQILHLPSAATDGSVSWVRLDNVPVMGRLVVMERRGGLASNYDCTPCPCPPNLSFISVTPTTTDVLPGGTSQFTCTCHEVDCNGVDWPMDVTLSSAWSSSDATVATVNTTGLVTGINGGSASITATFSDFTHTYIHTLQECSDNPKTLSSSGTANVPPTISGPNAVWWFNGQTPTGYATSINLTATFAGATSYQWNITSGSDKITLSNATSQTATVVGSALSASSGDVSVTVTVNGSVTSAAFTLTVRGPKTLVPGSIQHQADSSYGYVSSIGYTIRDNLNQNLSNVGVNESLGPVMNDYPNTSWVAAPPTGYTPTGATFADIITGQAVSPPPYPFPNAPSSPLGTTAVHHLAQSWFVGSTTPGSGGRVQTDTLQRYVDHAAHLNIVSPAP